MPYCFNQEIIDLKFVNIISFHESLFELSFVFSLRHAIFIGIRGQRVNQAIGEYLPMCGDRCRGHHGSGPNGPQIYHTSHMETRSLQLHDARVVIGDGCRDRLFEA